MPRCWMKSREGKMEKAEEKEIGRWPNLPMYDIPKSWSRDPESRELMQELNIHSNEYPPEEEMSKPELYKSQGRKRRRGEKGNSIVGKDRLLRGGDVDWN